MWISCDAFLREKKFLLADLLVKSISKALIPVKYNFFNKEMKRLIYENKTLFVLYYPEVLKSQTVN